MGGGGYLQTAMLGIILIVRILFDREAPIYTSDYVKLFGKRQTASFPTSLSFCRVKKPVKYNNSKYSRIKSCVR